MNLLGKKIFSFVDVAFSILFVSVVYGIKFRADFFGKFFVLYAIFMLFGVVGLSMVLCSRRAKNYRRSVCTISIPAIVYKVDTSRDEDGETYRAVFYFIYNDEGYEVTESTYTNAKPVVGAIEQIMINPADPNDFYCPARAAMVYRVLDIIGYIFILIGVVPVLCF